MSGGGGDNGIVGILPVAAALAATVMTDGAAAPMLGEALGAEAGVGATMLGAGVIGAGVGGTSALLTGQDPLRGALMGGATGAIGSGVGSAMDSSFASGLSSDAANGIGPGANLTQLGGQPFSQGAYDASTMAEDASFANPNFNPNPSISPPPSVPGTDPNLNVQAPTQSGLGATPQANTPPAATNPQNPNAAVNAIKPPDTGLLGTGITGKQALVGLSGLALYNAIRNENKKYGVPTTQNQVPSNLNYTYAQHTPMNLARSYAGGGMVDLSTSPIKQQINGISTGGNNMFPQPGLHSNQYANPVSTPVPGNVLSAPTDTPVDPYTGQQKMAAGGIAGAPSLGSYAAGGNPRLLKGPGDGMSDNIPATIGSKQPARLADGEFVVPADVVSHLGNGSTDAGAKKLHTMMDSVRKARTGRKSQGKEIKADKYMPKFADGGQIAGMPTIDAQLPTQQAQIAQAANQGLQNQNTVANNYATILNRVGDPSGTAYWNNQLNSGAKTPTTVTQNFLDSPEMAQNAATQTGSPQQNFINSLYQTNTGRAPDVSGNNYWNQQLSSGVTPNQVQQGIANTPEAQQYKAMQAITNPSMADQMAAYRNNMLNQYAPTDENFLKQQYLSTLGRAPDQAGMDAWMKQLQSGANPQDVANQFTNSQEAQHVNSIRQIMDSANNPSTNMSPGAISSLVNSAYQGNLGRAPDAAGAQYWSQQLASGKLTPQQFVDQLKSSAEFTNKSTGSGGVFGGGGGGGGTQTYDSSLTG